MAAVCANSGGIYLGTNHGDNLCSKNRQKERTKDRTEPDGEGEYFWGQVYGISREKKSTPNTECSPLTDTATDMYKPQTDVSFVLIYTDIHAQ